MDIVKNTTTPPIAHAAVAVRLTEMENASILRLIAAAGRGAKQDKRDVHILKASSNTKAHALLELLDDLIVAYKTVAPAPTAA